MFEKSNEVQGSGDQKFVPDVNPEVVQNLSAKSPRLAHLYEGISRPMFAIPPYGLGYPSDTTQSSYYPSGNLSEAEISSISKLLEQKGIYPENTRISKQSDANYAIHLASVQSGEPQTFSLDTERTVQIVPGDHASELTSMCSELSLAAAYAANDTQHAFLSAYIDSFQTGSLDRYRDSLRLWVKDKAPRVENIFGFVEPYRDPHGVRAEFEGLVAIVDDEETRLLGKLVENSAKFIRRLPWAVDGENDGKGPFEKKLFEPPDFSSIQSVFILPMC
jgi:dipeptidyl-peptidase-3